MAKRAQKLEIRRKQAEKRQRVHDELSPQQKLDKLDRKGHRAVKERARLETLIRETMPTRVKSKEEKKEEKKAEKRARKGNKK